MIKVVTKLSKARRLRCKSALRRMTKEKSRAWRRYRRRVRQRVGDEDENLLPQKSESLTSWDVA